MNARSLGAAMFRAGVVLVLLLAPAALAQQPAQTPAPPPSNAMVDCNLYAEAAYRLARLRALEARLELVIVQLRGDLAGPPVALVDAVVREARLVYAEGHPPEDARFHALVRCQAVLGRFGAES